MKSVALQSVQLRNNVVPIFLQQAEKTGLFDKYYLCTDSDCFPQENVSVIKIAADGGYSSNMIHLLNQIDDDLVFVILEDFILTDNQNKNAVEQCFEYCQANPRIGYLRMTHKDPRLTKILERRTLCGPVPKEFKYYICLQPGLWRRRFLLDCLKPGENAWDFEVFARDRARQNKDYDAYCTVDTVLHCDHYIIHGSPTPSYVEYLIKHRITFDRFGPKPHVYLKARKKHIPLISYLEQNYPKKQWSNLI